MAKQPETATDEERKRRARKFVGDPKAIKLIGRADDIEVVRTEPKRRPA